MLADEGPWKGASAVARADGQGLASGVAPYGITESSSSAKPTIARVHSWRSAVESTS